MVEAPAGLGGGAIGRRTVMFVDRWLSLVLEDDALALAEYRMGGARS